MPVRAIRELAALACLGRGALRETIDRIDAALAHFPRAASDVGLSAGTARAIAKRLAAARRDNAALFGA